MSKREIIELLPFYVNGTLADEERRAVEALLAEDGTLRDEVAALSRMRDAMKAETVGFSPGDIGLASLRRAIEAEEKPAQSKWGLIAACAAAVALVGMALLYSGLGRPEPHFVQAGAEAPANVVVIAFQPTAAQGDVDALLIAHDLTIVDGPSAIGLYRIAVPEGADAPALLAALRSETDVVESVSASE